MIWNLGAVRANNLIYITPPLTMLFSALVLGERITPFAVAGGALILRRRVYFPESKKVTAALGRLRRAACS